MERAEQDNQIVMRIVALLMSFAGLALRANYASWPVRCIMLAVLRRAESIARVYAFGEGVSALAPVRIHSGSANEFASLSLRFRILAQMLLIAVARSMRSALPLDRGWPEGAMDGMSVAASDAAGARAERRPECPDTS